MQLHTSDNNSDTQNDSRQVKPSAKELLLEFPWFRSNIFGRLQNITDEFFRRNYSLRFISVSFDNNNILFFGSKYFVNKIALNQSACVYIRLSAGLASSLLENTLGASSIPFSLSSMTTTETKLLQAFTLFIYKKLEGLFIKTEPNKKILKKSKIYNFTFFVRQDGSHKGKIIISLPDYAITGNIAYDFADETFDISCFDNAEVSVSLRAGSTRVPLNDLKAVEEGDVIILDNSDVSRMTLLLNGFEADFNITPNPALIISVDNNGDENMADDLNKNSGDMWDTIMVDVTAEFDDFKMTLGELKQISEGLLVDIGSVYEGRIKLRAAKQVIASGELVILNDRYGVRIDTVKDNSETSDEDEYDSEENEEIEQEPADAAPPPPPKPSAPAKKQPPNTAPAKKSPAGKSKENENFDYSDFEIEDESI